MVKVKRIVYIGLGLFGAVLLTLGLLVIVKYGKYRQDLSNIRSEAYDTVFFSMYPIDHYDEADYEHFRGMDIIKSSVEICDTNVMKLYMDMAVRSGNLISTAYLGIDPANADTEDIVQITLENPGVMFEIILAYPQMDYWLGMDEEECKTVWEGYREFAGNLLGMENVRIYYFCNEEWLLCNPANYTETFHTNAEVSKLLMCHSDYLHHNILNVDNFYPKFNEAWSLIEKYRTEPTEYPDASHVEIIFFGDSVIGNYTDSMSIPGIVNGLTNASVYNCGYGGKSAAKSAKTEISVSEIVEAFIRQDLDSLPTGTQVYAGVEHYIQNGNTDREKIFIINYGLNDYFDGLPVVAEDPYDAASFGGAMRTAVEALKEAYPGERIILLTPNLSAEFDAGEAIQSQVGSKLQAYADKVIELADRLNVEVLDNFRELPITKENHYILLADGTHPNEQGRFLIGKRIAEQIRQNFVKK